MPATGMRTSQSILGGRDAYAGGRFSFAVGIFCAEWPQRGGPSRDFVVSAPRSADISRAHEIMYRRELRIS
jgi:hypothetical protein